MSKLIALDFDHTLFDTDAFFNRDVRDVFSRYGISDEIWERSAEKAAVRGYTLETHTREIAGLCGSAFPHREARTLLKEHFSDLREYLFQDVPPFLEYARTRGWNIVLLSFGNPEWQKYKVGASGLTHMFSEMVFTSSHGGKAGELVRLASGCERVVMIDNSGKEVDAVQRAMTHAKTYRINRVPPEYSEPKDDASRLRYLEARTIMLRGAELVHRNCTTLPFEAL